MNDAALDLRSIFNGLVGFCRSHPLQHSGSLAICWAYDRITKLEAELARERERVAELEGLLAIARCPNKNCDNKGTLTEWDEHTGEVYPAPCQWCHEAGHTTDTTGGNTATGAMHPQGGRRP